MGKGVGDGASGQVGWAEVIQGLKVLPPDGSASDQQMALDGGRA